MSDRHPMTGNRMSPDEAAGVDVVFFGQQADVVAQAGKAVEQTPGLLPLTQELVVVGQPERARQEGPLPRRQAVVREATITTRLHRARQRVAKALVDSEQSEPGLSRST